MQRMITIQDDEVYVDLALVTSLSLDTAKTRDGSSRFPTKDVPVTMLYMSGGQLHVIKEPSFLKILGLTEATKEIKAGI